MYRHRSQRRLEKGDDVLVLQDRSGLGPGTIEWIDVLNKTYRFSPITGEHLRDVADGECCERVTCAMVRFKDYQSVFELSQLIRASQAYAYDALEPGDMIIHGKKAQKCGVVVEVSPRRQNKNGITAVKNSVTIIEKGIKKRLHPCYGIMMIQRAQDYLHFE